MQTQRIKKQVNQDQDLLMKAEHICDKFKLFIDGVRVMFLIHRAKEGSVSPNNDKVEKLISRNPEEFHRNLYILLCQKGESEDPLRIYSSVNARDMKKAVRQFKQEQLDADYYDRESHDSFYFDVRNRFIGSLMKPASAETSYFIIDIDSTEEYQTLIEVIANAGLSEKKIQQYPTKNGWHIVMNSFNPALLGVHASKIHKDALILLDY